VYLLLIWLLCPLAAFEVFFPLMLVPLFFTGSEICQRILSPSDNFRADITIYVIDAASQAAVLSVMLVIFSIIREPFSYCSLSLPGTNRGMITFLLYKEGSFFPAGILASSAGALLLLGYFTGIYQYCRSIFAPGELTK